MRECSTHVFIVRMGISCACSFAVSFQLYGSDVGKKIYIYGVLDASPLELFHNYGLAWSVGGWLLFHFLKRIGHEETSRLKQCVAANLKTTFAMHFSQTLSLDDLCDPDVLRSAARTATGAKYLVDLQTDAATVTDVDVR